MLFLSNSQFVREFYLLVWIEKDSSIKKKKKNKERKTSGSSVFQGWKYAEKTTQLQTQSKSPESRVYPYPQRMFLREWNQSLCREKANMCLVNSQKCFRTMVLHTSHLTPLHLGLWTIYYFILLLYQHCMLGVRKGDNCSPVHSLKLRVTTLGKPLPHLDLI